MLPQFAASAGYKHLSQFPGSTSLAISDRETGPGELGKIPLIQFHQKEIREQENMALLGMR